MLVGISVPDIRDVRFALETAFYLGHDNNMSFIIHVLHVRFHRVSPSVQRVSKFKLYC